jgi:hypothetical protein
MLFAAGLPLACSTATSADFAEDPPGVPGTNAKISFDPHTTLAISPGTIHEVTVITTPPKNYEVGFVLLGDTLNASLDRSTAVANADGRASVQLRAPDDPTTFRVRASLKEGPSAELDVAVSDEGFGSIRVMPIYQGKREVVEWTASMVARTTCSAIADTLPGEPPGAMKAIAPGDDTPILMNVPVGPNLAITLRAGHYIKGCADKADLAAGKQMDVKVTVTDVPLDLSATNLDLDFTYTPAPEPYAEMLSHALGLIKTTYLPEGGNASAVLLDTMEQLVTPDNAGAFATARMQNQWDVAVAQHFEALQMSSTSIQAQIGSWFDSGFVAEPPHVLGRLTAAGNIPGYALFELNKLGSAAAWEVGIPATHLMQWKAFPDDKVHLSGTLFWLPTRYAGAVVRRGARSLSQDYTMAEVLGEAPGCSTIAELLGGFGTCDKDCTLALCQQALDHRWALALDASAAGGAIGELQISSAAGTAQISDVAAPIAVVDGSWIGTVTDGTAAVDIPASEIKGKEAPLPPTP